MRGRALATSLAAAAFAGALPGCAARLGWLAATSPAHRVDLGRESVEVYVPAGCTGAPRCGALVWIAPWDAGHLPRGWRPALDEDRLVWVAANRSGNGRDLGERLALGVAAADYATQELAVDRERIYVGGLSGGGRVASMLALHHPERFCGGLFAIGADFFATVPSGDPRVASWPASFPPPDPARLALARTHPYVLLTGTRDFNRRELADLWLGYRAWGFGRARLVDVEGMGHELPSAACFARALALLTTGAPPDTGAASCPARVQ